MEGSLPRKYGNDAVEIPGARDLLDSLEAAGARWTIVTSGTRPLVEGWLDVMKLALPEHLVSAEEVSNGKPDPEGYLLGLKRLNLPAGSTAVVFEDAPAGVRAGKAAGFKVIGLATTHAVHQLEDAGADWIIQDLRSISLKGVDRKTGEVSLEIADALVR